MPWDPNRSNPSIKARSEVGKVSGPQSNCPLRLMILSLMDIRCCHRAAVKRCAVQGIKSWKSCMLRWDFWCHPKDPKKSPVPCVSKPFTLEVCRRMMDTCAGPQLTNDRCTEPRAACCRSYHPLYPFVFVSKRDPRCCQHRADFTCLSKKSAPQILMPENDRKVHKCQNPMKIP